MTSGTHSGDAIEFMYDARGRFDDDDLHTLGERMLARNPITGGPPAGFTYLGQFIAHDLTQLSTARDPPVHGVWPRQIRNPLLDLDSVYGADHARDPGADSMRLGATRGDARLPSTLTDLPRGNRGTPVIPDVRNDDNLFVAQIHVLFLRLHNYMLEHPAAGASGLTPFEFAKRQVIAIYHEIVRDDYLPRMLDHRVYEEVVLKGRFRTWRKPTVPVEFAVAAFRFGHPMVRSTYTANKGGPRAIGHFLQMNGRFGFGGRGFGLPQSQQVDLRSMFFDRRGPFAVGDDLSENHAHGISPALDMEILPEGHRQDNMAVRNLNRGNQLSMPSGQDVVREILTDSPEIGAALHIDVMTPEEVNKTGLLSGLGMCEQTPLWFYVLAEAHTLRRSWSLGPLGSYLVANVLAGLLELSGYPHPPVRPPSGRGWTMSELVHDVLRAD